MKTSKKDMTYNFNVCLLFFCTLLLWGCSGSSNGSNKNSKNLLPISFSTEIRSLDPSIGIDGQSQVTIKMLFEGLMTFDLKGNLIPALAKSYFVSTDHKTYTFILRDCNWSNGEPITAHDFEYSWKKVIRGNGAGSAVHNYYPIKNVRSIVKGEKSVDEAGVKALDAKTLVVELEYPTPYFIEALATTSFFPVNARIDKAHPEWVTQVGDNFVCSGPFTLAKHKHNDELVLLKNSKYWDTEHVKLSGIKIAIIKEANTQLIMYEKGELAWLGKPFSILSPDAIPSLKSHHEFNFVPSMGVHWYFINTEVFPFNNKKMRKAFSYAIDRKKITDHVIQTGEEPACGVLHKTLNVSNKPYFEDNNLAEAQKLFAEALQELGITKEQLPPIVLSYHTHEYHQRTAQVIQEQWEKAFGIPIRLENEEWKVHYQKLLSGNYQIGGMSWQSLLRDPIYIMQTFRDRFGGINMSRWENLEYQRLLDAAEQETDKEKRRALFYAAEKLLMEEMPVIPIYFTATSYAKKKRLKDVFISGVHQIDFRWASYEENDHKDTNDPNDKKRLQ